MQRQKGMTLSSLQGGGLAIVVLVIIIAIGAQILGQINSTQTAGTTEKNITTAGLTAMGQFANWFTILVLVIIAVVIISLLIRGLGGLGGE
jgi:type II secretory pathway component PulF